MDTAKEIDEKTGQQTTKRAHNLEKRKKSDLTEALSSDAWQKKTVGQQSNKAN